MSMSYWIVEGVGLNTERVRLDTEKCIQFIRKEFPDVEIEDDFNIEDYLYGECFDSVGDFLCHCDDTDTLTFGSDGNGGDYFLYPPSYPWTRERHMPQDINDVHARIIKAVQKVSAMTSDEIESIIQDDLYELGWG